MVIGAVTITVMVAVTINVMAMVIKTSHGRAGKEGRLKFFYLEPELVVHPLGFLRCSIFLLLNFLNV